MCFNPKGQLQPPQPPCTSPFALCPNLGTKEVGAGDPGVLPDALLVSIQRFQGLAPLH